VLASGEGVDDVAVKARSGTENGTETTVTTVGKPSSSLLYMGTLTQLL